MCLQTPVELVNSFSGPSQETMIHWVRLGQWICISNQFTNDGDAADPRTKIWELLLYLKLTFKKTVWINCETDWQTGGGMDCEFGISKYKLFIYKMNKQGPTA